METGNNTDTIIFGAPPKEDNQVQGVNDVQGKQEQPKGEQPETGKETSPEQKPKEEPKKEEQKKKADEPKGQEKEDAKESKETEKPSFKLNYPESEKKNDEPKKETEPKGEAQSITERDVLSFLEKSGIKVDSLSDISKKESLDEEVEKFKMFKKETNRGLRDFYNSQRDWNKESKETRIKEYLKWTNPSLSDEDIDTKLELLTLTEEEKETMTEREIKKAMLDFNELDAKALGYLSKKSKEYSLPKESTAQAPKQPTAEEIAAAHRPYWDARDGSLKKLEEISFNIDGVGEIKLPIEESDRELVKKNTQTVEDFIGRWKNKDGFDTGHLVEDTLWSQKESRDRMIQSMAEQIYALSIENFSKQNRNVNLNDAPKEKEKTKNGGLVVEGGGSKETFGKPIFG